MKYTFHQPVSVFEIGRRKTQEDALFPLHNQATAADRLFVVCDGMGGIARGEVASNTVATAIGRAVSRLDVENAVFTDDRFQQVMGEAYQSLDAAYTGGEPRMGTTLAMLCFHRGGCLMAHLGDSRIYHFRPATGDILYRSRDHSLVYQQYEQGEITLEQMRTSPQRNIILRAMQPKQDPRTPADIVHTTDLRPGDYFFVCTDGMLERIYDRELFSLLADESLTDQQKAQRLCQLTERNHDNHAAYIIHIESVVSEEMDAQQPNDEAAARAQCRALNDMSEEVEVEVINDDANDDDGATAMTSFIGGDSPFVPADNVPDPPPVSTMEAPQLERTSRSSLSMFIFAVVAAIVLFLGYLAWGHFKSQPTPPSDTPPAAVVVDSLSSDSLG